MILVLPNVALYYSIKYTLCMMKYLPLFHVSILPIEHYFTWCLICLKIRSSSLPGGVDEEGGEGLVGRVHITGGGGGVWFIFISDMKFVTLAVTIFRI